MGKYNKFKSLMHIFLAMLLISACSNINSNYIKDHHSKNKRTMSIKISGEWANAKSNSKSSNIKTIKRNIKPKADAREFDFKAKVKISPEPNNFQDLKQSNIETAE